jgi:uncharacterized membrane protein YfcA
MDFLTSSTQLSTTQMAIMLVVVFVAAIVRGFSGFALSALIMASLATILRPVEILPMNFILEAVAGLMMVRGGIKDADMRIVIALVIGSVVGMPVGLSLTTHVPVEVTRLMALSTILVLALLSVTNFRPRNLDSTAGRLGTGLISGIVTGIAGVGGMVIVIYIFSLGRKAKVIRASLVMYLFMTLVTSLFYLVFFGLMNSEVIWRGTFLSVPVVAGVLIGSSLFSKTHEKFYRVFCLGLLILLALTGLLRVIL